MRRALTTLAVALTLMPSACSIDLDIILFNTTTQPIIVVVGERRVEVAPLQSASFKAGALFRGEVSVLQAGAVYQYLPDPSATLPSTYYRSGGWAADIWAQLDPEFRVHLIPLSVSRPGAPSSDQPHGFPLEPVPRREHAA